MKPGIVTETDLECQLAVVDAAAAGGAAGIFGPASVVWRIDREAAIFLGGGRALLLQLAHPWVAAAIAQHSRTLADPIGRFRRTFSTVFTMVFGTTDQAFAAARLLHRKHAGVNGRLPERAGPFASGSWYRANDVAGLRWVHATLTETALLAYELIEAPLPREDRERYYAEMRLFAALFGIPESALPQNWDSFTDYIESMIESDILAVNGPARRLSNALLAGVPLWYRALTARLMPARLRDEFGLIFGPAKHRLAERALSAIRLAHPWMPTRIRYVAPYQEALARLDGRARPDPVTRVLNRIWIGQPSMATGETAVGGASPGEPRKSSAIANGGKIEAA